MLVTHIISNPGDNHGSAINTYLGGCSANTPNFGVPAGPRNSLLRRGGKLSPPGDGGHLTDFVAN